jgi:hypothetical protein
MKRLPDSNRAPGHPHPHFAAACFNPLADLISHLHVIPATVDFWYCARIANAPGMLDFVLMDAA